MVTVYVIAPTVLIASQWMKEHKRELLGKLELVDTCRYIAVSQQTPEKLHGVNGGVFVWINDPQKFFRSDIHKRNVDESRRLVQQICQRSGSTSFFLIGYV